MGTRLCFLLQKHQSPVPGELSPQRPRHCRWPAEKPEGCCQPMLHLHHQRLQSQPGSHRQVRRHLHPLKFRHLASRRQSPRHLRWCHQSRLHPKRPPSPSSSSSPSCAHPCQGRSRPQRHGPQSADLPVEPEIALEESPARQAVALHSQAPEAPARCAPPQLQAPLRTARPPPPECSCGCACSRPVSPGCSPPAPPPQTALPALWPSSHRPRLAVRRQALLRLRLGRPRTSRPRRAAGCPPAPMPCLSAAPPGRSGPPRGTPLRPAAGGRPHPAPPPRGCPPWGTGPPRSPS
mmetsp:Transcript_60490/g.146097  ORF Transcript_60490/g.146097 Transcript_60490/m.146097 type:complete len:292 (+) Transcript_60490:489-1364(+)